MADVVLFDHIGKTAGSTIHRVLWRVYGRKRVFMSTIVGTHQERIATLRDGLDTPRPSVAAVIAHTGYGLHERLPPQHRYRLFTLLRDPVQRTISNYHFEIQRGRLSASVSLTDWLDQDLSRAYNVQTAFLGGLALQQHLDGRALRKEDFTDDLLERAKAALRAHEVVGLTERFDEGLLLLSDAFGWSSRETCYVRANRGKRRARRASPTPEEIEAVRRANRLDAALYDHGRTLFETQLAARIPDVEDRLRDLRQRNRIYALSVPNLRRRLRRRAGRAARALGLRPGALSPPKP